MVCLWESCETFLRGLSQCLSGMHVVVIQNTRPPTGYKVDSLFDLDRCPMKENVVPRVLRYKKLLNNPDPKPYVHIYIYVSPS